jgi:hypothetical protein
MLPHRSPTHLKRGALRLALALLLGAVLQPVAAFAIRQQTLPDDGWWPGFDYPGVDWYVERLIVYEGQLVAANGFNTFNGVAIKPPARWDGVSWTRLYGFGQPWINNWVVWQGKLIATGSFYGVSDGQLGYWNGAEWVMFGPVLQSRARFLYSDGNLLLVLDEEGVFYQWIDPVWQPFETETAGFYSMRAFAGEAVSVRWRRIGEDGGGATVVVYRGGSWQALGGEWLSGTTDWPQFLVSAGDDLFLCAGTGQTGESYWFPHESQIYRWTGSNWEKVGPTLPVRVSRLLLHNGQLHALSTHSDGQPGNLVLRLENNEWQVRGFLDGEVWDAVSFGNSLAVCGIFSIAGELPVQGLACLDESGWKLLQEQGAGAGANGAVRAFLPFQGLLVAGGSFSSLGGKVCPGVAIGDGTRWDALGDGVDNSVFALAEFGGDLIAAGDFETAGGAPAARVARWDGQRWWPMGEGFNERVSALAVYNGQLYAGGWFTKSGSRWCPHLARWNGTQWQPVYGGVDGKVNALAIYDGLLVVGGEFRKTGGPPASYLVNFNGTSWVPFAWELALPVLALTTWRNNLVAGCVPGELYPIPGPGQSAMHGLALWNGTDWTWPEHPLEASGNAWIRSLGTYNGSLVLGGDTGGNMYFNRPYDYRQSTFALWNGAEWRVTAAEPRDAIRAIAEYGGSLFLGGDFWRVGDEASHYIARWNDGLLPATLVQVSAVRINTVIQLSWTAEGTTNHSGYQVFRETNGTDRVPLGDAVATSPNQFRFEDTAPPTGMVSYWIREIGPFGSENWHGPYAVTPLPAGLSAGEPTPNPFSDRTTFSFSLSAPDHVTLTVFDVRGRQVRTVLDKVLAPGLHAAEWDGLADDGRRASSGVYWMRMDAAERTVSRKVFLTR